MVAAAGVMEVLPVILLSGLRRAARPNADMNVETDSSYLLPTPTYILHTHLHTYLPTYMHTCIPTTY